jgi:hypothetical protein
MLAPRVRVDCKGTLEGNACGRLAIIIISYNKFRNGHWDQTIGSIPLHCRNMARSIVRVRQGDSRSDIRLEKSDKLDNMLINKIGY